VEEIPAGVARALNHLENNLTEAITPSTLAQSAGMAPHRFARFMKRFFGLTPSQYIIKARISYAARLLRETNRPSAEVAQSCGFYDHSAFTRAFRKLTGLTPTQLRTGHSNSNE
jgi:AraC-like DNA-binding protein